MVQKILNSINQSGSDFMKTNPENIKYLKVVENNYQSNLNSDYTEKIRELDRSFQYADNSDRYWTQPEQSIMYKTPLYEEASPSQKIALNHLFWVSQYNYAAYSEIETIDYNQITADCFSSLGSPYDLIARQLEHESAQEQIHIHAFYKVNYQSLKTLLGKQAFSKSPEPEKISHHQRRKSHQIANYQYRGLHLLAKLMGKGKEQYQSDYLRKLEAENKFSSTTTRGFFHGRGVLPPSVLHFFAANWGSSPFLSCQYYTIRFMGNMLLKNQEHSMFAYYKHLKKQGELIPIPTALSYYHFLDESFHTATSLFLARDFHKNFPKPTAYEKIIINLVVYLIQRINLSQVSGVVRNRFFGDDLSGMVDIYRLLRSPVFDMSDPEARSWVEKCFCQEHEGFHQSVKSHQRLLSEIRQLSECLDYLWTVNREMRLMALEGKIDRAITNNIKTFQQFSGLKL